MPSKTRFDTKTWEAIKANIESVGVGSHVKVGVLASRGGDAEHGDDGITLIELAAIHEFGSPAANIPERSFIRRTFNASSAELRVMQTKLAAAVLRGMPVPKALSILGAWAANAIKRTITGDHIPPPLKPATIARKGSDRPLVDSGRLLGAISFEVVLRGGSE